jgi:hypothetical protein
MAFTCYSEKRILMQKNELKLNKARAFRKGIAQHNLKLVNVSSILVFTQLLNSPLKYRFHPWHRQGNQDLCWTS